MSLPALALALALAHGPCPGERVVLLPLRPVALPATEARRAEELVRGALEALPDACVEPRADTVARARDSKPTGCADSACWGAQVVALGTDRLLHGVALGVGGAPSVALTLVDREGRESRATLELSPAPAPPGEDEARAREVLTGVWKARAEPRRAPRASRVLPTVLLAAGGVALAAGVGLGLAVRREEQRLSAGDTGCGGEGEAFRDCFAARLREGRTRALAANVLWGTGAVLGAGGATLLFVWTTP